MVGNRFSKKIMVFGVGASKDALGLSTVRDYNFKVNCVLYWGHLLLNL